MAFLESVVQPAKVNVEKVARQAEILSTRRPAKIQRRTVKYRILRLNQAMCLPWCTCPVLFKLIASTSYGVLSPPLLPVVNDVPDVSSLRRRIRQVHCQTLDRDVLVGQQPVCWRFECPLHKVD